MTLARTGLFLLTIGELLLYITALPIVTVSWRTVVFYSAIGNVKDVMQFDRLLLETLVELGKDSMYVIPFFVVVFSWRSVQLFKEMKAAPTSSESRDRVLHQAGEC